MNIRPLKVSEIDRLETFLLPLYHESERYKKNGFIYKSVDAKKSVESIIKTGGTVIIAEKDNKIIGAIGGFISPWWCNYDHRIATELLLYVQKVNTWPKELFRLIDAFCDWAITKGAIIVEIARLPHLKKMDRVFKRKGFFESDQYFARSLKNG